MCIAYKRLQYFVYEHNFVDKIAQKHSVDSPKCGWLRYASSPPYDNTAGFYVVYQIFLDLSLFYRR